MWPICFIPEPTWNEDTLAELDGSAAQDTVDNRRANTRLSTANLTPFIILSCFVVLVSFTALVTVM